MTSCSVPDHVVVASDGRVLRAAVAAYLGRYRGESRVHTGSDLKVFLTWRASQDLDPLSLGRAEIERFVRWLQEVRRFQPSTVSRRLSVVVGFYRVCVIDQILLHSTADYVRRPPMPTDSPTLGLGHDGQVKIHQCIAQRDTSHQPALHEAGIPRRCRRLVRPSRRLPGMEDVLGLSLADAQLPHRLIRRRATTCASIIRN